MLFDQVNPNSFSILPSKDGKFYNISGPDIQIPKFVCNYGVSENEYGGTKKYSLDLTVHESEKTKQFVSWIRSVEENVINYVKKNASEIFDEDVNVEELLKSSLTEQTLRIKIDNETKAKDEDGNFIDICSGGAMRDKTCVAVLRLKTLYFMNNTMGLVWKGLQLQFAKRKSQPRGFLFLAQ